MQEKSRYTADRIARTEMARAWADGFLADIMQDDDVVAVKWKLSSRHPVFDVCDMYSKANMYNLGSGIYPKSKIPPLPAHPHCLCSCITVYAGEVDLKKQKDCIKAEGEKWLANLSDDHRRKVLGIQGNKAFKRGADWREYMRNWTEPQSMESRISGLMEKNLFPPTDAFIASLAQKYGMTYTKGKKGEDRFYSDDGRPIYPPNNGAVGKEEKTVLPKGTVVSRYGSNRGKYTSPDGTSLGERSLDKKTRYDNELHRFKLTEEFECIEGVVAPWFDQVGRGIQYKFSKSIEQLIKEGVLIEI